MLAELGSGPDGISAAEAEALRRLARTLARTIRAGRERELDACGLVPGDVVLIGAGAKVPADCRVLCSGSAPCRRPCSAAWAASPASSASGLWPARCSASRWAPCRARSSPSSRSETLSVFGKSPFSNRFLFVGTLAALAIHTAALYLPVTQFALDLEPIDLRSWLEILAISSSVIVAVELHKLLRRPRARV